MGRQFEPHYGVRGTLDEVQAQVANIHRYLVELGHDSKSAAQQSQGAVNQGTAVAVSGIGAGTTDAKLSGDVTGLESRNTVSQLQGVTLTVTSPATGEVLTYNGTAVVNSSTISGSITIAGDLTLSAHNLITDTTTGTKLATSTAQKLGLWGATPVARPAAYTVTNSTPDRSYDANATTLNELAQVVAALVADLQSIGAIG